MIIAIIDVIIKDKFDKYMISIQAFDTKEISEKQYYFYQLFSYLDLYASGDISSVILLNGVYANHQLLCNNLDCQCAGRPLNLCLDSIIDKTMNEYEGKDLLKLQGSEEVEKQR